MIFIYNLKLSRHHYTVKSLGDVSVGVSALLFRYCLEKTLITSTPEDGERDSA
jgi:hypothetical protein